MLSQLFPMLQLGHSCHPGISLDLLSCAQAGRSVYFTTCCKRINIMNGVLFVSQQTELAQSNALPTISVGRLSIWGMKHKHSYSHMDLLISLAMTEMKRRGTKRIMGIDFLLILIY